MIPSGALNLSGICELCGGPAPQSWIRDPTTQLVYYACAQCRDRGIRNGRYRETGR